MMRQRQVAILTDVALITCIVQRGLADKIIKAATEAGAQGATVYYARGTGVRERLGVLGIAVQAEKEVVDIVVARDQVDRIFEKMYLAGELGTPGMGFMFVSPLEKAATYVRPDVLKRLAREAEQEGDGT